MVCHKSTHYDSSIDQTTPQRWGGLALGDLRIAPMFVGGNVELPCRVPVGDVLL
jgi:hypothetical protein